jgi:CBS domain-containing protein
MHLADYLPEDGGFIVPFSETEQDAQLLALLRLIVPEADATRLERLARDIYEGRAGELVQASSASIRAVQTDLTDQVRIAIGTSTEDFDPDAGRPNVLVLILTPRRISALRDQVLPSLVRLFREEDHLRRVLAARRPEELEAIGALMELEIREHLLVEDALVPVQYRVYPETPFEEVVDLMIRRSLHSVPVVGADYEFLGIVTTGDALRNLLPRVRARRGRHASHTGAEILARDVMTRSVMCVSEDQSLVDAANTMVTRDVEQLPVVRESALVGVIDRKSVLELVFGQAGFTGEHNIETASEG